MIVFRWKRWAWFLWVLLGGLGMVFWWMTFYYAPREKVMGDVQRIFYMHLPLAWTALLAFILSAVAHAGTLIHQKASWLTAGWAHSWCGFVLSLLVLGTGMSWAKPIWGSWWPWEPRLTSMFILVMMYGAYLVLYDMLLPARKFQVISAYNLLCAINIPIVMVAPRIWKGLHPVVIEQGKINLEPEMWHTILVGFAWQLLLYLFLFSGATVYARLRLHWVERLQGFARS